jgi:deoxyribodipyrimidine photo-lyase
MSSMGSTSGGDDIDGGKGGKDDDTLYPKDVIRQIYWRDFYYQLAWYNPHVFGAPLQPKYKAIPWEENRANITHWMRGSTGVPIVDAGMRQLNQEGWISNRMRLIVSCYLVKIIGANWLLGERYFAMQLEDYDPAVNNGNWQWVASTGADSQPYIRTFNPSLQSKAHDPNATYIKKWVPELNNLTPQEIHKYAQNYDILIAKYRLAYPQPILNFDERKKVIINWYKNIATPSHKTKKK